MAGAPHPLWQEQGYLTACPGDIVDRDMVEDYVRQLCTRLAVQEIAFDRYAAGEMMNRLDADGLPVVEFRQNFSIYTPAINAFERAMFERRLVHGGNPLLRWAVGNVVLAADTLELAGPRVTIASVGGNTSQTLAAPWTGACQSGMAYLLRYDAPSRFTSFNLMTKVRNLIAKTSILERTAPFYQAQSIGSNTSPGSPVTNDMYVVGPAPTGAWSGLANNLAQWTGSAWQFMAPTPAMTVSTDSDIYIYGGASWVAQLGGTAPQALRGLTAAAGSFPRFSDGGSAVMQVMVGTVSQAAELPTEAIVERGSNANGEYVKYADGTMMCWRTVSGVSLATQADVVFSLYRTPVQTVDMPVPFVGAVAGQMSLGFAAGWLPALGSTTTTQWFYQLVSATHRASAVAASNPTFFAVGRWF